MVPIYNKTPLWETGLLSAVFLSSTIGAVWLLATILGLETWVVVLTVTVFAVADVFCLVTVLKKTTQTRFGSLQVDPLNQVAMLNGKPAKFEDFTFYKSYLIAPRLGIAAGYSAQTVSFGVSERDKFTIADDIAARSWGPEQFSTMERLCAGSGLTVDERESFRNWLQRVQQLR